MKYPANSMSGVTTIGVNVMATYLSETRVPIIRA